MSKDTKAPIIANDQLDYFIGNTRSGEVDARDILKMCRSRFDHDEGRIGQFQDDAQGVIADKEAVIAKLTNKCAELEAANAELMIAPPPAPPATSPLAVVE